jgi:hypothetical protein
LLQQQLADKLTDTGLVEGERSEGNCENGGGTGRAALARAGKGNYARRGRSGQQGIRDTEAVGEGGVLTAVEPVFEVHGAEKTADVARFRKGGGNELGLLENASRPASGLQVLVGSLMTGCEARGKGWFLPGSSDERSQMG